MLALFIESLPKDETSIEKRQISRSMFEKSICGRLATMLGTKIGKSKAEKRILYEYSKNVR
jgi:hypothetical protein